MRTATRITSLSNPRVKAVVKLRRHRQRRQTGLCIAEGPRQVERAAAAGLGMREVYCCSDLWTGVIPSAFVGSGDVARFDVSEAVFRKMAYRRDPEGVLAVVAQPRWSLEGLAPVTPEALLLVAVGTAKPGNLGAMVRTADAAGCAAVVCAGAEVDAFNPNAIRSSTAAVFTMPTVCVPEEAARAWLTDCGFRVLAAAPDGAVAHTAVDLTGRVAVVIGPEAAGLSEAWLGLADATGGGRVGVRMRGHTVDSLNASAAAAVLLFEAARQRTRPRDGPEGKGGGQRTN